MSSSSSPSPPLQHTFYPPFYGRPPTPLPPSPSLTSLLRPSRPTTPDISSNNNSSSGDSSSSEIDTESNQGATGKKKKKKKTLPLPINNNNNNNNNKNSSSSNNNKDNTNTNNNNSSSSKKKKKSKHTTLPPRAAPPIVPTYEYYGFVLYLFSSLTFLIYLLWSYLPSPFLHALGIYYYPNRWWSLALPSFLVMLLLYIYVALATYNTSYLTLPLQSMETIVDESSKVATLDHHGTRRKERSIQDWREVWDYATDAVMDVPLGGVCEILYGDLREESESP